MANHTPERSPLRLFAARGTRMRLLGGGLLLALAAGAALSLWGAALTTQHAQTEIPERIGPRRCLYSDDCPSGQVCEGIYCRVECRTTRDCRNGWVCIDGALRGVKTEVGGVLYDTATGGGKFNVCADPRMLGAQPASASEQNTSRPGMDYDFFPVGTMDEQLCRKRCEEDPKCVSFTYVKPRLHAATAYCYLKGGAPAPFPESCCTSGVVRPVGVAVPAAKPK